MVKLENYHLVCKKAHQMTFLLVSNTEVRATVMSTLSLWSTSGTQGILCSLDLLSGDLNLLDVELFNRNIFTCVNAP